MIAVLRIGHRPERDKRITTHVALVARAFGADKIMVDLEDREMEETFAGVNERFGGDVVLETGVSWRSVVKNWEGKIVHLTMYGLELDEGAPAVPKDEDILVIVGAEKVPGDVYRAADFNISVGNQPHSEVAALAMFLDRYFEGKALRDYEGRMKIIPSNEGKHVVEGGN